MNNIVLNQYLLKWYDIDREVVDVFLTEDGGPITETFVSLDPNGAEELSFQTLLDPIIDDKNLLDQVVAVLNCWLGNVSQEVEKENSMEDPYFR